MKSFDLIPSEPVSTTMGPKAGSPQPHVCQVFNFQLLPSPNIPDLHSTPQPLSWAPISVSSVAGLLLGCVASSRQGPASPFFTSWCLTPGLAHGSLAVVAGKNPTAVGRPTPTYRVSSTGQVGPSENRKHMTQETMSQELLWPDGQSSQEAGDLDFYVKYSKFYRLSQMYILPRPRKHIGGWLQAGAQDGELC